MIFIFKLSKILIREISFRIKRLEAGFQLGLKNFSIIKKINKVQVLRQNSLHRFFIQIGAGAGDLDERAGFKDGFSKIVKSVKLTEKDVIVLVEPNPLNINKLEKSWVGYQNVEIHEIAISEKSSAGKTLSFYFADNDAPHFQVASLSPHHVLNHYKDLLISDLKVIEVPTHDLESFLQTVTNGSPIVLLALDIEGLDAEIILDTNFSEFDISIISFEYVHLGDRAIQVADHLGKFGFRYIGLGVDHNGFDHLFFRKLSDSKI